MHRLQICVFAGISFSMTGKYSDGAAREYLILLMMKRNFAGAVSSSSERGMLSCCAFAQADLNIFVSRSWQFCRSEHQTFTHEQRQIGSDYARACGMINGKKLLIIFVCAGLTLTPRAQVYLCLRCYHKFMRDKERILIFSTYDEFKHPLIFGVCALLLILLRINKQKTLLSSSHFVFCSVFS